MNTTTSIQDKAFEIRANGEMTHETFIAIQNLMIATERLAK